MSRPPAYKHVAAELRRKIATGSLPVGEALPSMSQLREMYQVSSTVVRDALNELRREGLVEGQQGKGVFVRKRPDSTEPAADDSRTIRERLDVLAQAVQQLDERMSRLERAVAQGAQAQPPTTQAVD